MGLLRAQEITDVECTCFNHPKIGDISRSLTEKKVKFKKKIHPAGYTMQAQNLNL